MERQAFLVRHLTLSSCESLRKRLPRPPGHTGSRQGSAVDVDELPSAMSQAVGHDRRKFFRQIAERASHIWIGGGRSTARCRRTSARFSPPCSAAEEQRDAVSGRRRDDARRERSRSLGRIRGGVLFIGCRLFLGVHQFQDFDRRVVVVDAPSLAPLDGSTRPTRASAPGPRPRRCPIASRPAAELPGSSAACPGDGRVGRSRT